MIDLNIWLRLAGDWSVLALLTLSAKQIEFAGGA